MVNYKNSKIYKIINDVDSMVYIGSSTAQLSKRFHDHKCRSKNEKYSNIPLYQHMNIIGTEKFHIILICNYPCENIEQCFMKEREEFDKIKPELRLNKLKPKITKKEKNYISYKWRIENREHCKNLAKQNRIKRKDITREKRKIDSKKYRDQNKTKFKESYTRSRCLSRINLLKILPFCFEECKN